MATLAKEKKDFQFDSQLVIVNVGQVKTELYMSQYVEKNFPRFFSGILNDHGLYAEEQYLMERTYDLMLEFYISDPKRKKLTRILQAAGVRTISNYCLSIGKKFNLRDVSKSLNLHLKFLYSFPRFSILTQINIICESLREKLPENVFIKMMGFTEYYFKQGILYPKSIVAISLIDAGTFWNINYSMPDVAKIIGISPSTAYLLRKKFPNTLR